MLDRRFLLTDLASSAAAFGACRETRTRNYVSPQSFLSVALCSSATAH
jgi:hypothetical protein